VGPVGRSRRPQPTRAGTSGGRWYALPARDTSRRAEPERMRRPVWRSRAACPDRRRTSYVRYITAERRFSAQNISSTLCYMASKGDSSVFRSLAVAFADGLAFGAGMKLTQQRTGSAPAAIATTPDVDPLLERLRHLEQRMSIAERTHATLPA